MNFLDITNYQLTASSIPYLVVGISLLVLGIIVLVKNLHDYTNVIFFLTTFALSLWLIGNGIAFTSINETVALPWVTLSVLGVMLLMAPGWGLTLAFVEDRKLKQKVAYAFIATVPFIILLLSGNFVVSVGVFNWGYYAEIGPWGIPYLLVVFFIFYRIPIDYVKALQGNKLSTRKRKQVLILFIAMLVAGFAVVDAIPMFTDGPYFPVGFIALGIWALIMYFAIISSRLFSVTPENTARDIIATMRDSLFLTDVNGNIEFVNKASVQLMEYSKKELESMRILDLLDPKNKEKFLEGERLLLKEKNSTKVVETTMIRNGNDKVSTAISISQIVDKYGDNRGRVYVVRDITNRKKMEKDLKENMEEMKRLNSVLVNRELKMVEMKEEMRKIKANKAKRK